MNWKIDNSHSQIHFAVRHMMISTVRGEFSRFSGQLNFDEQNPTRSWVEVEIEAGSINTNETTRDGHLQSADFLDAERYPTLRFKSKRIEQIDGTHGRITGDLTIRDVTREVVLDAEFAGIAKSPWGSTSAGFNAETKINRKDFGLTWNKTLETGGVLVGDEIKIEIELEAIRAEEAETLAVAEAEHSAGD